MHEKKLILVVDDEKAILELLSFKLRAANYEVVTSRNGREALQVLDQLPIIPSLILLDLRMPEMDGWEFRVHQKENPEYANIPVVVITNAQKLQSDLRTIDCKALIKKPIETEILLSTVDRFALNAEDKATGFGRSPHNDGGGAGSGDGGDGSADSSADGGGSRSGSGNSENEGGGERSAA